MVKINGKDFGSSILSLSSSNLSKYFSPSEIRKLRPYIERISTLHNSWELLWKWRDLKYKTQCLAFFKVQSSARHPEVKLKYTQFIKEKSLREFIKYQDKYYHISPIDYIRYSHHNDSNELNKTDVPEFFAAIGKMSDSQKISFDFEGPVITSMKDYAPWIVQASMAEIDAPDVQEIFKREDYLGNYISDKKGFTMNNVFDFSNWENDLTLIASDTYYGEPVVYLRVPLRTYNTDKKEDINFLIRNKMKELGVSAQSSINCNEWELALMCDDLKTEKIPPSIITKLSKVLGYKIDVKEKLKQSKKLINNSITKDRFPY